MQRYGQCFLCYFNGDLLSTGKIGSVTPTYGPCTSYMDFISKSLTSVLVGVPSHNEKDGTCSVFCSHSCFVEHGSLRAEQSMSRCVLTWV